MGNKVIQLHDGELPAEQAARVITEIGASGARQDLLASIERIDGAARAMDQVLGPSPEQVQRGKAALKAALNREARGRRRRRLAGIAAGLAAAACVALAFRPDRAGPPVGTVRYQAIQDVSEGSPEAALRLGSTIHAPPETSAVLRVSGIAAMSLAQNGALKIGDRAADFTLTRGLVSVEAIAPLTISIGDTGYVIHVEANTALRIAIIAETLDVRLRRGSSTVSGQGLRKTLSAPGKLRLTLRRFREGTQ